MDFHSTDECPQIPVISIEGGKSNSGKTTLLVKIIREAKRRGWRVAILKHDVHGFEMDKPGKDTWRHAQAGADIVGDLFHRERASRLTYRIRSSLLRIDPIIRNQKR